MPETIRLQPQAPWVEIRSTKADWAAADPKLLGAMLTHLHLIRAFEEKVLELVGEGLVHGPAHSSIGQEGGAVGSVMALRASDRSTARIAATTSSSRRRSPIWRRTGSIR